MMQEGAVEEAAALGPCSATAERTLGLAPVSYTHLDVYKRQAILPVRRITERT